MMMYDNVLDHVHDDHYLAIKVTELRQISSMAEGNAAIDEADHLASLMNWCAQVVNATRSN